MPRPKLINPRKTVQIRIAEDIYARCLASLYSTAEGCVPYAKWSEFVELLIREHFRKIDEAKAAEREVPDHQELDDGA